MHTFRDDTDNATWNLDEEEGLEDGDEWDDGDETEDEDTISDTEEEDEF